MTSATPLATAGDRGFESLSGAWCFLRKRERSMSDELIPVPIAHNTPDGRQWISTDEYMLLRRAYEQLREENNGLVCGLRDRFAAAAMQGIIGQSAWCGDVAPVVQAAFTVADAMLAARERKEG